MYEITILPEMIHNISIEFYRIVLREILESNGVIDIFTIFLHLMKYSRSKRLTLPSRIYFVANKVAIRLAKLSKLN